MGLRLLAGRIVGRENIELKRKIAVWTWVRLSHKVTVGESHGREPMEQVSTCRFQS